jgi:hypothetical protein
MFEHVFPGDKLRLTRFEEGCSPLGLRRPPAIHLGLVGLLLVEARQQIRCDPSTVLGREREHFVPQVVRGLGHAEIVTTPGAVGWRRAPGELPSWPSSSSTRARAFPWVENSVGGQGGVGPAGAEGVSPPDDTTSEADER